VVIRVAGGPPPAAQNSPGDDDTDTPRKNGENEGRNREHTNQAGKDDESIEGDVLETRCDDPWPSVVIANRDGAVAVKLLKEAQKALVHPGRRLPGGRRREAARAAVLRQTP
jgi:hypothetical protein